MACCQGFGVSAHGCDRSDPVSRSKQFMREFKKLSRRRFLSAAASTVATSCLPLSGAALLAASPAHALSAPGGQTGPSHESATPAPVMVVNPGYRLLIDSVKGTIVSMRSTFGVDRPLLI